MLNFQNYDEIKDLIQREDVEIIDLKFIDLLGAWRHVTIPARTFSENTIREGYGIDGSSVFSAKKVTRGDMSIIPDIKAAFMDPFWGDPCLSFICNIVDAKTKEDSELDTRCVARRAEAHLAKQNFADEIHIAPELECYLLDEVEWRNTDNAAFSRVGSHQSSPPTMEDDPEHFTRPRIKRQTGYLVAPPQDSNFIVRQEICFLLEEIGIPIKYHHHEVGSLGQEEIEFEFLPFLRGCDSALVSKYFIKNSAIEHGMIATFMPKPIANQTGSGLHIHMYLRKNGKPVFYEKGGYADLSKLALYFIAGIFEHSRAIMALSCASTNSYRRLKPGFETPTAFFFSEANREAAIRIPGYATSPEDKRIEFRLADATGNIYLTVSAIIMAGIDGIKRKIDPTERGFGPFDGRGPELKFGTENKRLFIPHNFEEALYAINDDMGFLCDDGVFTQNFLKSYIDYKWKNEILEIWGKPHPYEFELYFDL